jgi:hypothetical protein
MPKHKRIQAARPRTPTLTYSSGVPGWDAVTGAFTCQGCGRSLGTWIGRIPVANIKCGSCGHVHSIPQ